jgi:serine/threonine protein kinase
MEELEDTPKEYYLRQTLGTGNFASVKLGNHKTTEERVAVKCIDKKKMVGGSSREEAIRDEINILERVSHPNIIQIR